MILHPRSPVIDFNQKSHLVTEIVLFRSTLDLLLGSLTNHQYRMITPGSRTKMESQKR
jgi:hypothetical protein